jgi:tRNA/tmRNA/rRNA uracil-C5-methylase (TrmA/RlmC/RlmD family)
MVYANLSPAAEADAKEAQLKEFFERARLLPAEFSRIPCRQPPLNYRNKAVYHFEKSRDGWVLGYRREPEHTIVDVEADPLARPEINAKLPEIRRHVLTLLTQGAPSVRRDVARQGSVTVRWSARSGVKWWLGAAPKDAVLRETTCSRVFEVPAGGFYQVNPVAGEALVQAVVNAYRREAETAPEVLDLYCDVGVFGLCCAGPAGAPLTGIESGRDAIAFARRNAAAQGVAATFRAEQVGRCLSRLAVGPRTTVIVDPPRGGLERGVPEGLVRARAPRLFYVSCDPATLLRDLKILSRGYEVAAVRWIDLFPRTARFETFVELKRKGM